MLILLSPAKSLNYESEYPNLRATKPRFLNLSAQLASHMRKYSEAELGSLMSLSEKLAALNTERFAAWEQEHQKGPQCRPCLFAFQGDVYQGMRAETWSEDEIKRSQDQLRILSGLYGVLRPLDLMKAYRLEMGTKLKGSLGQNLDEFWKETSTQSLQDDLKASQGKAVINLASQEYSKSIDLNSFDAPVISPVFKDAKNGKYKIISFYAKKARGFMAAWIIQNKVTEIKALKKFNQAGYRYSAEESTESHPVFLREEQ